MSGSEACAEPAAALETSSRRPSVVLAVGGELHLRVLDGGRPHASDLLPALAELLAECGLRARELGLVAAGLGPGSYTGLRVGCAAALGLARGARALLVGVPSFEALAWRALAPGQRCTVLRDARAGALYVARYERADGESAPGVLCAPRAVPYDEIAAFLRASEGDRLLGDDAVLARVPADLRAGVERDAAPCASAVLELARGRAPGAGLEPLYLRPFAAHAPSAHA